MGQLQGAKRGAERTLPRNYLELLPSKTSHSLLPTDPATRWISFLLCNKRPSLAIQVFSEYLHHGASFSFSAMTVFCEAAVSSQSSKGPRLFAKHTSLLAVKLKKDDLPVVNQLILMFYRHKKYEAVLELGTPFLKGGLIDTLSFRHIIRSLFYVHHKQRNNYPTGRISNAKALLSFLSDWLTARRQHDQALDQFDIAILIRGLSSLLRKRHRLEHALAGSTQASILSLLKILSRHVSGPISKFNAAESMLDLHESSQTTGNLSTHTGTIFSYEDIIAWAVRWNESTQHNTQRLATKSPGAVVKQSRVLMILARDRLHHGDAVGAIKHVEDISRIQSMLSTSLSRRLRLRNTLVTPHEIALSRRYMKDARLRFTSALIRVCSHLLRLQDLEALFRVLPLTRNLEDMDTFVRLWKRSIHLFVSLGTWDGRLGLKSLLFVFMKSIPQGWKTETLGEIVLNTSGLMSGVARVAGGLDTKGNGDTKTTQPKNGQGDCMNRLAREQPQVIQELEAILSPSSMSLPSSWREALIEITGQKQTKALNDSLLDRLKSNMK